MPVRLPEYSVNPSCRTIWRTSSFLSLAHARRVREGVSSPRPCGQLCGGRRSAPDPDRSSRSQSDHPPNRVGEGAEASPSGLVMEIPRFHERLRMRTNAVRPMPVPQSGREPLRLIVRFLAGATRFVLDSIYCRGDSMPKKRKRLTPGATAIAERRR